jgi:hypothetical protein
MKTRLMILFGPMFFLWINSSQGQAATLDDTRAGDHQDFTRVVFELKNFSQYMEPVVNEEDKLSVRFPQTTTPLPSLIKYRATERVDWIQFLQQENSLAANIALSIPYFKVKSYFLSDPERFVIDIYWSRTSAPFEAVPIEKTIGGGLIEPDMTAVREAPEVSEARPVKPVEQAPEEKTGVNAAARLAPVSEAGLLSTSRYGLMQTFFLAGLNLFTLVIIVMLTMILSRQIRVVDSAEPECLPGNRKAPTDLIAALDEKIKQGLNRMTYTEGRHDA